jgi:hypothetical protein
MQIAGETLLVVGLCLVTFWKSLSVHFLAADYDWISIAKFGQDEFQASALPFSSYRKFSGELIQWIYQFWGGEDPFRYRLLLLMIHVVNSVLCGKLIARILGRPRVAWIGAAIFAIAPASAEAVHSIAAFVYPCVALLLMSGLLCYDKAISTGRVLPWGCAMICFAAAFPLREHALVAFPLAFLLEWLRGGGVGVFKTRGPWLRIGVPVLLGTAALLLRDGAASLLRIPQSPDYQLTASMAERLLVTLQRLVLPPVPMDFKTWAFVHKFIGFALLAGVLFVISIAEPTDRRRGFFLLLAMFISLVPFLPVPGDHVRQRFTYFATVFAAGLAAFVISVAAERISARVALPVVLAILAGLLLEQQAEFERDYVRKADESQARYSCYLQAGAFVKEENGIALFAGDKEPSIVTARSTVRVVAEVNRKQMVLIKAKNSEELYVELDRLRELTGAKGGVRLFVRGAGGYDRLRVAEVEGVASRVFEHESGDGPDRVIFALLPKPLPDNHAASR